MKRSELEALQLERLKWTVGYCYKNVPFYTKKLDEAGVTADKIKSLSDIKYIPPTTKADLRDNYPFGLFARPMKDMVRIHASSGTTGKPTVVGYTRHDLDIWSDCVARIVAAAGATDEDIVQISFGYGMFTGALGLHYGLEKLGATVIPNSSGNTEKALMYMRDFGTTALVATPSYALYMCEVAKELDYPMSDYKLRLGLLGSEGCTPEMRTQIENGWGLFATDNYGMSELMGPGVSGECEERDGLHFCEDYFYPEIVDPVTLKPLPDGEYGELVFTCIGKEALPLLRYRTRDISAITHEKCACGRTLVKMLRPKGRSDDMLIIRGVNVFPAQVEHVILSLGMAPNYQIIVDRANNLDIMTVCIEMSDNMFSDSVRQIEAKEKEICGAMQSVLGVSAKVRLVEPHSLPRYEGKASRVIDNRKI